MYFRFSILLRQSFKNDMEIKFVGKDEIAWNHWDDMTFDHVSIW